MSGTQLTVAILGTGDMGSAVARCLAENGASVITCLEGRSPGSRELALAAGMNDKGSLDEMLLQADVLLSIIPPASAVEFAARVCPLLGESIRDPLFVDCNAVAPQSVSEIAGISAVHQVRFQDVGIIGAAPCPERPAVRFYTSGPFVNEIERLATELIDVRPIGDEIGRASAIKMVYASLTKATHAIRAAAVIAGEKLGVGDELRAEWQDSLPDAYTAMRNRLPRLPAVSGRWIGEMREIALTYESLGLTPAFHEGAAWMYELIASIESANDADFEQLAGLLVEALETRSAT